MAHNEHNRQKKGGGFVLIIFGALLLFLAPNLHTDNPELGIASLVFGIIIRYLIASMRGNSTGFIFTNRGMWISLFLTGFMVHFVLDILHLNAWYCKNYKFENI